MDQWSSAAARLTLVILTAWLLTTDIAAGQARDASGKDHPMITRYPGSRIIEYRHQEFAQSDLAIAFQDPKNPSEVVKKTFEGKVTTLIYEVVGDQSALQVFRNYEQALARSRLKTMLSCFNQTCGNRLSVALYRNGNKENLYRAMLYDSIDNSTSDFGYVSASGSASGASAAVGVFVARIRTSDRTYVGVDIIESAPMKSDLIVVDVDKLRNDIEEQGKVVLSGIYFDTDKDVVKPESDQALQAIATYLKGVQQSFYVVGHSDSVGAYERNVDLSRRRAQAVVNVLATKHAIQKERLTAIGIGPVSPTGSNASDGGRANNRRVELVLR